MEKKPCRCQRCNNCEYFKIKYRNVCSRCRDGRCKCKICDQTRKKVDDKKRCKCTDKYKFLRNKNLSNNNLSNKNFSIDNLKNDINLDNINVKSDEDSIKSDEISSSIKEENINNVLLNKYNYNIDEYISIYSLLMLRNNI